jgi:hypothetical protein
MTYCRYRRLRPVVRILPRRVAEAYGAYDHCTFGQARRVITDMRLHASIVPYAYATVCRQRELDKGFPLSAEEYRRLRAELAEIFDLRSSAFTIRDLIAPVYSSGGGGSDGTPIGDAG